MGITTRVKQSDNECKGLDGEPKNSRMKGGKGENLLPPMRRTHSAAAEQEGWIDATNAVRPAALIKNGTLPGE